MLSSLLDDDTLRFPEGSLNEDGFLTPSRLFRSFMRETTLPSVNIKDNQKNFELELAVPGHKKEDLKVNVKDGILTVSSEKKHENEEEKQGYTRREFSYSSFTRSFMLPDNVDPDSIKASYHDGLLKLSIAKTKDLPESKGREINIG
jgi:HSP20 family protein